MDTEHQQQERSAHETPRADGAPNREGSTSTGSAGAAGSAGGRNEASQHRETPDEQVPAASRAPLAPGTRVGDYIVGRMLRDVAGQRIYLATGADAGANEGAEEPAERFLLQLLPAGSAESASAIEVVIGSDLQHSRMLVPRERVAFEGGVYLALEGLPVSAAVPRFASDGVRLSPVAALRAGAGLADALSYLHRSGVAHLHISPEVILLQDERAYLTGLERVVMLDEPGREPLRSIADDTNALARTLGLLTGMAPGQTSVATGTASEAEAALSEIIARGAAGEFTTPDEIAAAAGAGLLTAPHPVPPGASTNARLRLRHGLATTVGAVRTENQDAAAAVVFSLMDDAAGSHLPTGVFLVADGMGGEAHGELASRIAARVVPAEVLRTYVLPLVTHPALAITSPEAPAPESTQTALAQTLSEAVAAANRKIREMGDYFRQDTGSTLTALAVAGSLGVIAHLGDSRAYLLRAGAMTQLTEDHTLLARLHAMDHPILSDANMYVPRNFLYRSLGQEQAPPDLVDVALAPGDRLLICSDGLWDEVDDATIVRELAAGDDPARIAERLVELANLAGGHDNSTALVLFAEAAPEPTAGGSEAQPAAAVNADEAAERDTESGGEVRAAVGEE